MMNRRSLLASLLLSPLTRLLGRRAATPPIQLLTRADEPDVGLATEERSCAW
jgi:hypothetical protein